MECEIRQKKEWISGGQPISLDFPSFLSVKTVKSSNMLGAETPWTCFVSSLGHIKSFTLPIMTVNRKYPEGDIQEPWWVFKSHETHDTDSSD